jgi:NAD(P)-dependent dehydrogenase (short-subunit alcohol dehydrogenase family)
MNKVVMITGGSKGIGKALAMKFSDMGYKVVICSRTRKDLDDIAIRATLRTEFCDVRHKDHVKKLFENVMNEYGRIDVLINCAGILGPMGHLEDNDINEWRNAIDTNLMGTVNCVHEVIPIMRKQKSGRIINFAGGGVGGNKLEPGFSAYATSKFAVAGFTETISKELDFFNIQINAVSPGAVNTDMANQRWVKGDSPDKIVELIVFLVTTDKNINGKMISAVWDDYQNTDYTKESIYNLRRTI